VRDNPKSSNKHNELTVYAMRHKSGAVMIPVPGRPIIASVASGT